MPSLLIAAAAPLSLLSVLPIAAGQNATSEAVSVDVIKAVRDSSDRMTVPVRIGNNGPYDFLIDTGAERTVLARGLADRLGLVPSGRATMVGVAGSLAVDLVDVAEVKLGSRSFYDLSAPLLEGQHIGADGIIGLDGLQNQRVLIDFKRNLIAVATARELGGNNGYEIVVRARRRGDQLIMTNALVDGIKTDVVIDTGAQGTIGNRALQRAMARRRAPERTTLTSVTGQEIAADLVFARRVTIGNLDFSNLAMMFADAPPFERLNLGDKPALLLGMGQLRAFQRVAIDFQEKKILFDLPSSDAKTGTRIRG
ncbi:retroviral-like aspartic protease family protein [Novosphingobium sp. Gsoil 351]|uniref:retroviral-like aspartic protease family protein n=1 Tax=Novosphingobium sp. Gsoil 351 TaxID=2675225 RepID=UPI0012B46AD4|nr:retroviral-like aspartic protease family protein [Novosphingobium sp. Gsoil 351]QGN53861.1 peptidase A2A [Novosphingobium sp. Gsoil 351]